MGQRCKESAMGECMEDVSQELVARDDALAGWSEEIARQSWLIVPLYNEGRVIRDVMSRARAVFPNIVCVDDGSRDDSASEARAAGVHLVRHPVNLGQRAALRTGLDYALSQKGARYFVTFDSDGQHQTEDAQRMILRLREKRADVVIGSRFLGVKSNAGRLKRVVLKTAVAFERLRTGLKLTDAHNGLRALNRRAAQTIQIHQNRMAHASEITSEIGRNRLMYLEEPVRIVYTDYSRAKGQSVWNMVNILSDLLLKKV